MGQQQLILLALAVIIVGGAIVVGIRAFNENSIKSNADAMMQDAVRIANDMQAWKQKPAPFGGQASVSGVTQTNLDDPADFTGAAFGLLGYKIDSGNGLTAVYRNLNGEFQISNQATSGSATITGRNVAFGNEIAVVVSGLDDTTVNGSITCLGSVNPGDSSDCTVASFGGTTP